MSRVAFLCKLCKKLIPYEEAKAAFDAGNRSSIHKDLQPDSDCEGPVMTIAVPEPPTLIIEGLNLDDLIEAQDTPELLECMFYQFTYFAGRFVN